jgi:crotonobetainyl-CoA:carnitine CoA-transferase CaiB-like acyl-CoA transferase
VVCSAETEGPYALFGQIQSRHGRARSSVTLKGGDILYNPLLWECQDGDVAFNMMLNQTSAKTNLAMMDCIKKDGIDIGFLERWEWDKKTWQDMTPAQAQELMKIIGQFFLGHTKAELLELAVKNRFQLGPCNTAADVLRHPQLAARGFWKEVAHPGLEDKLKYPGGAVMSSQGYVGVHRRAPLIGEHNDEIYRQLLGMSEGEVRTLKERRVV